MTSLKLLFFLCAVSAGWHSIATAQSTSSANLDPAGDLVVRALQAEVAGKNDERIKLLQEAVTISPDDSPARWHLEQIKHGKVWRSPEDIAKSAMNDPVFLSSMNFAHSSLVVKRFWFMMPLRPSEPTASFPDCEVQPSRSD